MCVGRGGVAKGTEKYGSMMYKAVVRTVLLYRSRSWVVTESMLKVLEGFHHLVAQRIAVMSDHQVGEEVWECSLVAEELEATCS